MAGDYNRVNAKKSSQSGKPIARVRTTRRFACRGQNALAEARGGSVKLQGESQRGKFLVGNIGGDWMGMEGNVRERELAIWTIFGGGVNRPRFFWSPEF